MKFLILLLLVSCKSSNCVPEYKTVKKVGGCNRYGECGVIYDDGSYGSYVHQPVEGMFVEASCK